MMTDRAEFVRGFEALAAGAALVKVGEDDAILLYGEPLDALRARLVDLGVDAVLATQGAVRGDDRGGRHRRHPARSRTCPGASSTRWVPATPRSPRPSRRSRDGQPADEDAWGAVLERAMDVAAATCRFEGALLRLPRVARRRRPGPHRHLTAALATAGSATGDRIFAVRFGRVRWVIAPPLDCTSRSGARLASYPSGQRDLTVNQPA